MTAASTHGATGRHSQAEIARFVRASLLTHLYDSTRPSPDATAVYTLSDPREIRAVRYVGQTRAPRRRYLQHLAAARLWLPEETPWWIKSPRLRPLYAWIRTLYRDERRLPVMVVDSWVEPGTDARLAERDAILRCLRESCALLNFEAEVLGAQIPLL